MPPLDRLLMDFDREISAPTPLRVLYSFPARVGVPGGVGTIAWGHVTGLVRRGVEVTLVCGTCERPIDGMAGLVETMRLGTLRWPYRLLGNDRTFAIHDMRAARHLRRMAAARAVDVFHGWPRGSLASLRAAADLGVRSILERPNAHTAFAYDAVAREHARLGLPVPAGSTHAFSRTRLAREEAEYAAADALACPSDFVARTFADRGHSPDRLARHHYGFDPGRFRPDEPDEEANHPAGGLRALFVGSLEPRKGLHTALEAWHRSGVAGRGELVLCGGFSAGYRERLGRLLDHPSVKVLGYVGDVSGEMRAADVLLLPSVEEGSALVTYEARACGCVLLVSDSSGAHCEPGADALIHRTGDVDELAAHLRELAADPRRLADLRASSLAGIGRLTWADAAQRLVGVYHELLSTPPHRPQPLKPIAAGR